MTINTKCNARINGAGRFRTFPCNRPVKEGDKCGVHCTSAVERRKDKSEKALNERLSAEKHRERVRAISLLKLEGYSIIDKSGLKIC